MIRYNTKAVIAARQDEALTHGQVLYGLIKPTKDMEQIESTAAMVNVIPKKRIYRMETIDELELFMTELMKRPLVLQPSAHIGRGFSVISCSFYTKEEKWILLINQIHGKIRSKLEIGVQTARTWMAAGVPFTLTISLNEYLQRMYFDYLTKAVLNPKFTFVEFTDAEIVIRYPGARGLGTRRGEETRLTFEDLLPSELVRRGVTEAQSEWRNPALRVVMPDELNQFLPGWGFEQEDPFAGLEESEDELDEGATGGIDITQEREQLMPPGAARNAGGGGEAPQGSGRVMGRAQRRANQNKYQVPVELHVPEEGGPQRLDGKVGEMWDLPPPHYEDLQRNRPVIEHPYERKHFQNSGAPRSPHSPHSREDPYEDVNRSNGQPYSTAAHSPNTPNSLPSPSDPKRMGIPSSPRTPGSGPRSNHSDMYGRDTSRSPRTPSSPHISQAKSPRTPTTSRQNMDNPQTPRTPTTPRYDSSDRYNSEPVDTYSPRRPQQTYLTDENDDDDDGGFSPGGQRLRSQHQNENKYMPDYNRNIDSRGYQNRDYNPQDRYASPSSPRDIHRTSPNDGHNDHPVPPPRGNFPPSNRPVPSQRVLHHYQGSGRSDTTTSDSGFDDYDSSRNTDKYSDHNIGKAPYYNHAFEKDMSPERDTTVNDILAQHKAMAAKMLQQKQSVPNTNSRHGDTGYGHHSDNMYGREIQKWRRNINELQVACDDDTSVGFSQNTLSNYQDQEQMAESFI